MTKTIVLHCYGCGSPLPIISNANQVTCPYCGLVNKITYDDGDPTAAIDALNQRAEQLADDILLLELNKSLLELDRAWDQEIETYKFKNSDGSGKLLGPTEAILRASPFAFLGAWLLMIAIDTNAPINIGLIILFFFGLAAIAVSVFEAYQNLKKVWSYQMAVARYYDQRDKLLSQIAKVEKRLKEKAKQN